MPERARIQSARHQASAGVLLKIVAVLLTEGVSFGDRGLDIMGLKTNLCAAHGLLVDFLHATVVLDLNPQDSGPLYEIHTEIRDPSNEVIAESRTRMTLAVGIQGSPSVISLPLGAIFLDHYGPHIVNVRVGPATGSVAFDFQDQL